jgi:undecaprenyl-diphosphatase
MLFFYALIFSIVQAVTEFLPVSSSGHLIIFHKILDFSVVDTLTFDVALHIGTAIALLIYFRCEIYKYFKAFLSMFSGFNLGNEEQKTVINLIIATIPAVFIGIFFESIIEGIFRNILVVSIALIVGGIIIIIAERFSQKKITYEGLSLPESFLIGCAQSLALIPGVSRSGATIITGMILKLKRSEAAKFSFLLSIPIVLGAGLKKFFDLDLNLLSSLEWQLFGFGILMSLILSYFVIKYFLQFIQTKSLSVFGYYRIIVGVILLLISLI